MDEFGQSSLGLGFLQFESYKMIYSTSNVNGECFLVSSCQLCVKKSVVNRKNV